MRQKNPVASTSTAPVVGTQTATLVPVIGCLNVAEQLLGSGRTWNANNDAQLHFIQNLLEVGRSELREVVGLESIADRSVEVPNSFLRARGFSIQLEPTAGPDPLYLASVFEIVIDWFKAGETTTIRDRYPGVEISKHGSFVMKSPGHNYPIGQIRTKSGDQVYMTVLDRPPVGVFHLAALTMSIEEGMHYTDEYEGVIFPMIDYQAELDLAWIEGMWTTDSAGRPAVITEAIQQTKFKMNEKGARMRSAVGMGVMRLAMEVPAPPLRIDQPFLLWIRRDGVTQPLFAAYFREDVWKNPGAL